MHEPLITVIVPVYKVEPYLERCVSSIRNQTYENLEIILVDDGSPDRCGEMCDAFAAEDPRIRVIHKQNGGQSSARNLGLDHMTGEYVAFVDSDDWIEPQMYQRLYNHMVEHNAQLVCCGILQDYPSGKSVHFDSTYSGETDLIVYSMLEALEESLNNLKITYSPCDKLYHRSIFADLRMTEGRIFEDMEMIPKCVERTQTLVYDPYPYYHYNLTEESTIRGEFNLRRCAEADVALEKAEYYKTAYPHLYVKAMCKYYSICLNIVHVSWNVESCNGRRGQMIKELKSHIPDDILHSLGKKDRLKLTILRLSPWLYHFMMLVYDMTRG